MRCKSVKNKLPLYVSADLNRRTKEKVEVHLGSCPDCQQELKSLEEALRRIKEADLAQSQKIASWDEESWLAIREEIGLAAVNRRAKPAQTTKRRRRYALGLATAVGIFLIGILAYLLTERAGEKSPVINAANQDVVRPEIKTQPVRIQAEVSRPPKEPGPQAKKAEISSPVGETEQEQSLRQKEGLSGKQPSEGRQVAQTQAPVSTGKEASQVSDLSSVKTSEQLEERIEMAFILPESGIQVVWILDRNFNLEGEKK